MLRCIIFLAAICISSAAIAFGVAGPVPVGMQSMCLTLTALSAAMLVSSFDAFETQTVRVDRDEDA